MSDPSTELLPDLDDGQLRSREDLTGRERMARNIVASWAGHMVFVVAGFVMPRFMDRHIGQAALGVWDFGWSLVSYLSLAQGGIGSSVNRFVARYRAQSDQIALNCAVASVMCIQLVATGIVLVLTCVAVWSVPSLLSQQLAGQIGDARWVVGLLGMSLAVQMAFDSYRGVITGCHRWDLHNGINALFYAGTVVVMISLLVAGGGLRSQAAAYFAGVVATEMARVVMAYRVCPGLSVRLSHARRRQALEMLYFGGKSLGSSLSSLLLYQTNSIIVMAFLGPASLAVYSRSRSLVSQARTFINKFGFVLTPVAGSLDAENRRGELQRLVVTSARFSAYLSLPIVLLLAIMGDPILHLWMGPKYQLSSVLGILAIGYLAEMINQPVMGIMTGLNAHGRLAFAGLAAALCSVAMGVFAVGFLHWGLIGAALSLAVPLTLVNGLYVPIYTCRKLGIPFLHYLEQTCKGPIVCAIFFGSCLFAARFGLGERPLAALIIGGITGATVICLYHWRRTLDPRQRQRVIATMHRAFERTGHLLRRLTSTIQTTARTSLRRMILLGIRSSGLIRLARFSHRNEILILTIHGVMDLQEKAPWLPLRSRLSLSQLDYTLRVLSQYYQFVPLAEAIDMLAGRIPVRPYSIALTFDDGYRNNMTHAMPILRRYNVEPTIFLATGHVETGSPLVWDRLDYALQHSTIDGRVIHVGGQAIRVTAKDRSGLTESYLQIREAAKSCPRNHVAMQQELEQLAWSLEEESGQRLGIDVSADPWAAFLSWSDIEQLASEGVSFGSHTVDHVHLGRVDAACAREQMRRSSLSIGQHLGTPCLWLCYPNGSFNEHTGTLAQGCGYVCALTTIQGFNRVGDGLMTLRRMNVPLQANGTELLMRLSGVSKLASSLKSLLGNCFRKPSSPVSVNVSPTF